MAHLKKSAATGHLLKNAAGHLVYTCPGGTGCDCAAGTEDAYVAAADITLATGCYVPGTGTSGNYYKFAWNFLTGTPNGKSACLPYQVTPGCVWTNQTSGGPTPVMGGIERQEFFDSSCTSFAGVFGDSTPQIIWRIERAGTNVTVTGVSVASIQIFKSTKTIVACAMSAEVFTNELTSANVAPLVGAYGGTVTVTLGCPP